MNYFYLDASALVKRYTTEPGSPVMDLLLERLLPRYSAHLLTSWMGFLEVVSVLSRQRNIGRLDEDTLRLALARLTDESIKLCFLPVDDQGIARALDLVLRHNLNASDALYLRQMLDWQAAHDVEPEPLILVAADERLLRAAQTEGLRVFNPESASPDTVEALLNA